MEEFQWEYIDKKEVQNTQRAKVLGGWIVVHITSIPFTGKMSESMVFIPDPEHKWEAPNE